ncbi:MAG: RtcB family protein [Pseudomonadota bacterium]
MAPPPQIRQISETTWELPPDYKAGMLVPARILATRELLEAMDSGVFDQVTNVATLPGIVRYALCMPDGHWGYGFPIGGVAAMDAEEGVISPGGIGFDINCGMRLLVTNLSFGEVEPHLEALVNALFKRVPAGVGSSGFLKLSRKEFREVLTEGSQWCVQHGLGWPEDLERTENGGKAPGANPAAVSDKAVERGIGQIGTLGSGNHYLEIQVLRKENIMDRDVAQRLGLFPDQVVIMFHCGSRGFGHQVASDYLASFLRIMEPKYNIRVLDRELAAAPFRSPEGQAYFQAMNCALNMSYANRQVILHRVREVFSGFFGRSAEDLGMHQIYDVAHNTARVERHLVDGRWRELVVHRKGATRAFPPGCADLPESLRDIGQPVIIGGSMETGSFLLLGVETGAETFFSTAHGSGRTMSRAKARKQYRGKEIIERLRQRGIHLRSASFSGLAEEAGAAYKDIDEVVAATARAGLSRPVARLVPVGNIKG